MAAKISGIHDGFFKRLCAMPEMASEICRLAFPPKISALCDWPRLAVARDSFHDGKRADLVLAAPLLESSNVLTYIVVEHKSQYEPKKTFAQFYRYYTQFTNGYLEEHGKLPEILSVLVSQRRPSGRLSAAVCWRREVI